MMISWFYFQVTAFPSINFSTLMTLQWR